MTAHEFDPDRFLDERLKEYLLPNPFIFLPFNAGPRICLGQQVGFYLTFPFFSSLSPCLFVFDEYPCSLPPTLALPHGPDLSLFFVFPVPPPHRIDTKLKLVLAQVLLAVAFFSLSFFPLYFVFDARGQGVHLFAITYAALLHSPSCSHSSSPDTLLILTRAYPIHAVRI